MELKLRQTEAVIEMEVEVGFEGCGVAGVWGWVVSYQSRGPLLGSFRC